MKFKHTLKTLVSTLFLSLMLTGCLGITQPTEENVTELTLAYFDQQFADLFTAEKIVKKNGYKDGDGRYIAEIVITANAQRSLEEYATFLMESQNISPLEKIQRGMKIGLLKITLPPFKSGDPIQFERNYLFIKSDNGWLLKKEILQD